MARFQIRIATAVPVTGALIIQGPEVGNSLDLVRFLMFFVTLVEMSLILDVRDHSGSLDDVSCFFRNSFGLKAGCFSSNV